MRDQAWVIDLPKVAKKCAKGCVGLSKDQIKFMAFNEEFCLCIWVLTDIYEWSLLRRLSIIDELRNFDYNFCKLLGFQPYSNIVYIGLNHRQGASIIMLVDFSKNISPGKEYLCKIKQ